MVASATSSAVPAPLDAMVQSIITRADLDRELLVALVQQRRERFYNPTAPQALR